MSIVRYDAGTVLMLDGAGYRVLRVEDCDQIEVEHVDTKARKIVPAGVFALARATPSPDLANIPEALWRIAHRREPVIRRLSELPRRRKDDVRRAAAELGLGVNQTYTLLKRFTEKPVVTSLLPGKPGLAKGRRVLDEAVETVIAQAIDDYYATRKRPKLQDLVAEVERRCTASGLSVPARNTVAQRVAARPRLDMVRKRQSGRTARALGPAPGVFPGADHPFACVQFDHTLVDVIVVDDVTREPLGRPWLTLGIDVHSRMVAGFHLSMLAPSAVSVALATTHTVLVKDRHLERYGVTAPWPVCGLPERIHVDNGKEFRSEAFSRGCAQYGIKLEYRPVKTPHYGGHIERLIGTMMGKVHLLPGTTFANVQEKGEKDPRRDAALTLAELEEWLTLQIVEVYHRTRHRGIGEPPLSRWERGIVGNRETPGRGLPPRVADPKRFFTDFLPAKARRVRRQGIVWDQIWYWSDALRPFVGERTALVRRDPRDLSRIYLLEADGTEYLEIPYANLTRPPISLWEQRRALALLKQDSAPFLDEIAIFRAVERMRRLEDEAVSRTRSARRNKAVRPSVSSSVAPAESTPEPKRLPPPTDAAPEAPRPKRRFGDLRSLGAARHEPTASS